MQKGFKIFMFSMLMIFIGHSVAADVSRPSANNKLGHTKSKNDSFFKNIFDYEDTKATKAITDNNDKVIQQIKILSELKDEGVLSKEEFEDKKKILLKKIK